MPGDTVLPDLGFDISDSVGFYCSTLTIAAFTRGKTQPSGIDVEQTRPISNIRIYVERVIGNIRQKYSLLSAVQFIKIVSSADETTPTLDKVVCYLCSY